MLTLRYASLAAYAAAFAITVLLARYATPRHWWRQANARALAVLALGTWGIGSLLAPVAAAALPPAAAARAPQPGQRYVVFRDLNLRAAAGTGAPRIATLPQGATVTATGRHEGDWWQLNIGRRSGWASSLWLRKATEVQQDVNRVD